MRHPLLIQITELPGLFLELGHKHNDERTDERKEHSSDNNPGDYFLSDLLSGSAAHFFFLMIGLQSS